MSERDQQSHLPSSTQCHDLKHVEELRHVAAMDQCSWDYAQKLMRSSADQLERLREALESIMENVEDGSETWLLAYEALK